MNAIDFPQDDSTGYVVGGQSSIFGTSDGGMTWDSSPSPQPGLTFIAVCFPTNADTGYIAADMGDVFGTPDSGPLHIGIVNRDVKPPVLNTELQVTPTPSRRLATIHYTMTGPGLVQLELYAVTGARVRVLASDVEVAGAHNLQFDRNGLARGVYFLKLQIPARIETQKVVLE